MFDFLKKSIDSFSYPLDAKDATSGNPLSKYVPDERLYKIGPFYCDTSPVSHVGQFKHAIDFVVEDGSCVYAAKSGIVVDFHEDSEIYGSTKEYADKLNYVTLTHDDKVCSQYAHLSKGSVSAAGLYVGKEVMRGQLIGKVGKSGWVEFGEFGDHLHFMVFQEALGSFESLPVKFKDI